MNKPKLLGSRRTLFIRCILLLLSVAVSDVAQAAPPPPAGAKTAEVYTAWPFDAKEAARRQDETAKALGTTKAVKVDLGGGVAIEFILIPAGKIHDGRCARA